jgi:glycine/D-amino acid oxidase-like deaminating enzyme
MSSPDVVVVGGGIVGIAVAASCARRGLAVTLCEAGGLAQEASGRNQGLVIGPNLPEMEAIGRHTLELLLDLHERSGAAFAFDREPYPCLMLGEEDAAAAIVAPRKPRRESRIGSVILILPLCSPRRRPVPVWQG